jgi:hypothetical protein
MPLRAPDEIVAIDGRTPTPRVRGNLPPVSEGGPDRGREVPPVRPMEWYERASPRTSGGGSLQTGPWPAPPRPPEGFPSRDLVDTAQLPKRNPELYAAPTEQYASGGRVKHGSSTHVTCKEKSHG